MITKLHKHILYIIISQVVVTNTVFIYNTHNCYSNPDPGSYMHVVVVLVVHYPVVVVVALVVT